MEQKSKFPLRLECMQEVGEWASKHGMSVNAAINHMCREFLDAEHAEIIRLRSDNEMLRTTLLNIALDRPTGAVR